MAENKKAAPETIEMEDGQIKEFAGKRRMIKESTIDEKTGEVTIRLDFRNGAVRNFKVPKSLTSRFVAHGAEQKLGDEIAGLTDVGDAVLAVDSLIDRLNKGEWSQRRASSGMAGTSVLQRALVEHTGKTPEEIREFLSEKTQAEKMALRSHKDIKPIIEKLEADKAKKSNIDSNALLGELG